MSIIPAVDQIDEIPAATEQKVPQEYIDENNHMNIQHYLVLGATALGTRCDELGLGQDYIDSRRLTIFTAEHHLRYYSELLLGQELSVHVRMLERSSKVIHAMSFLVNRSDNLLACTLEVTLVHVGMDTRRPVDFPEDIADRVDAAIKDQSQLPWPAPVCGVMGVRRG
jgi:acyl-CoA thioester hydrolase